MVHGNQNTHTNATKNLVYKDRHTPILTSKAELARKYHRFKHEMGFAQSTHKSNHSNVTNSSRSGSDVISMNQTVLLNQTEMISTNGTSAAINGTNQTES